jgi:hypothetical protein
MQAELTLRCREDVEDRAIQQRIVGHDMAERSGGGPRRRVRRHRPIAASLVPRDQRQVNARHSISLKLLIWP